MKHALERELGYEDFRRIPFTYLVVQKNHKNRIYPRDIAEKKYVAFSEFRVSEKLKRTRIMIGQ